MLPRDRRKRRPPIKVVTAPTIPSVIIEGLPVAGNSFPVGLTTRPPFVCVWAGKTVGEIVLKGTVVTVGIMVGTVVTFGTAVGEGLEDMVGLGIGDTLTVGATDGAGGLVCCPAA
jgi:hypothetical protein